MHEWSNRRMNCNMKFTLKTTKALEEINILFKDLLLAQVLLVANGLLVMQMLPSAKFLLRGL